jgi:hypothetical protein
LSSEESVRGRKANIQNKLKGALLGVLSAGVRAKGYGDNTWTINGYSVRFHSLNKGGKSFTLNPSTEPESIVVAFSRDEVTEDKPLKCAIYGLKRADCMRVGQLVESKTNPGRVSVHLSGVPKDRLGTAYLPAKYTEAETTMDRDKMMKAIDALTSEEMASMMDSITKSNIREFVMEGRETETPAIAPTASPVAEELGFTVEEKPTGEVLAAKQTEHGGAEEQLVVEHAETVEEHGVVADPLSSVDQVPPEQFREELSSVAGAGSPASGS